MLRLSGRRCRRRAGPCPRRPSGRPGATRYGAAVMIPVSVVATPSSRASGRPVARWKRQSNQCAGIGRIGLAQRSVHRREVRLHVHPGRAVEELDLAVEAVAAQVHEAAAALLDPRERPLERPLRPVLGVRADHQHPVGVEVERPVVQLRVRVDVVGEALALEPRQQPPLGGREVVRLAAGDRVGRPRRRCGTELNGSGRSNESGRNASSGRRPIRGGLRLVARQLLAPVDGRLGRQAGRVDVVAAPAEVVVRVPGVGRQHDGHRDPSAAARRPPARRPTAPRRTRRTRPRRRRSTGRRSPAPSRAACGAGCRSPTLLQRDAGLGVVAVGGDLHDRVAARARPTSRGCRTNSRSARIARATAGTARAHGTSSSARSPARTQRGHTKPVRRSRQQPELVRPPVLGDRDRHPLAAEAVLAERDVVAARRDVGDDARRGAWT